MALSSTNQSTITEIFEILYENSATAAAALDAAAGNDIRIGGTTAGAGFAYPGDNVVKYDLSQFDNVYYFNDHGRLVQMPPSLL